ncbi:MAG: hypothetical protein JNL58_04680 [Planctomyces sp.]|nr:hypothetical protein [Planctomyces sp.]
MNHSWGRRLESLRNQLTAQNRRATGPFSHPLAKLGPLQKLREHIRDLSRLADAAILNAEASSPERMQTLINDLKMLLQTQQSWTDRLENQIWRLESQAKWQNQLLELIRSENLNPCDLGEFCSGLAGETTSLPSGILLLPEPGLSFAPERAFVGWSRSLSWTVEMARISAFTASSLHPDLAGDHLVRSALLASIHSAKDVSEDIHQTDSFRQVIQICVDSQQPVAHSVSNLVQLVRRFMLLIEDVSLSSQDRLIPPELVDLYSRSCRQLSSVTHVADSGNKDVTSGCRDFETTGSMVQEFVKSIGLTNLEKAAFAVGESTILTHKLRWHDAEMPSRNRRSHTNSIVAAPAKPKLLLICDEDSAESAETAELLVN